MTYNHGKKLAEEHIANPIVSKSDDGIKFIRMIYKDCKQGWNKLDKLIHDSENKILAESKGFIDFIKVELPNGAIIASSIYKNVDRDVYGNSCEQVRVYFIKKPC